MNHSQKLLSGIGILSLLVVWGLVGSHYNAFSPLKSNVLEPNESEENLFQLVAEMESVAVELENLDSQYTTIALELPTYDYQIANAQAETLSLEQVGATLSARAETLAANTVDAQKKYTDANKVFVDLQKWRSVLSPALKSKIKVIDDRLKKNISNTERKQLNTNKAKLLKDDLAAKDVAIAKAKAKADETKKSRDAALATETQNKADLAKNTADVANSKDAAKEAADKKNEALKKYQPLQDAICFKVIPGLPDPLPTFVPSVCDEESSGNKTPCQEQNETRYRRFTDGISSMEWSHDRANQIVERDCSLKTQIWEG